jgi:hypothetical protein
LGSGQVAVEAQLVRLTKRDERGLSHTKTAERVQDGVQIKKLDQEEQIVFGEVYAPGFPDSQGDFMSAGEIKKMAYNFIRKGALSNIDTNHTQQLAVWLDGSVEFETSDGDLRQVSAGGFVLVGDTHGKGHI